MTTTIEAIYEQGVLRLKEPLAIADGEVVEVTITTLDEAAPDALSDLLGRCAVDTGIQDLAEQHDHYLYGTPKRD
ncbi:MAG: antitoxin family protein [Pyrinomonadaceae bacterium]